MDNTFTIQQGDQYAIPFSVTAGGVVVTPDNCDDLRIQVGCHLKSYSAGTLGYNVEDQMWLFPVSESDTTALDMSAAYQVGVKVGGQFVYSATGVILIDRSIIKEAWSP